MTNIHWITDFSAPELDVYARLSENQLTHYYEPETGLFIAESAKVIHRALDAGYQPASFFLEKGQLHKEGEALLRRCPQVPVYVAEAEQMKQLTGYALTGGILCAMKRRPLPSLAELCEGKHRLVVLEQVMNPTNVGAILRSAAALGMEGLLLAGGCSDPLYRRAARVSMGNVFLLPWTVWDEREGDWYELGVERLRSLGYCTLALALREDSVSMEDPALLSEKKLAILLGAEGDGLSPATIAACDYKVKIPMARGVDSLNVAAASAVAFWQLRWRHE